MDGGQLALVQHLQLSHRKIEKTLGDVGARLKSAQDAQSANLDWRELNDCFAGLRREIRRHFSKEAAGGCLEEATIGVPGLSVELEHLEQQHRALLDELDEIMTTNRQQHLDCDWRDTLCAQFCEFRRHMHEHEAAESRLIQVGLNINLDLGEGRPSGHATATEARPTRLPR